MLPPQRQTYSRAAPSQTDTLTNEDQSPMEQTRGEEVTEHDEPANANSIIHYVWLHILQFYLWSKFVTLPGCFAPARLH